ncbi:PREDICTED: thiamine-repressible mitochondrial transport protein THI74 [Tarenaya hassleriana]|uniref:thiamine-repressible mitochondrial transport protein THI74 n=1 Tax=Tarenaya hassleriana TaxID=28532 RepID=UPI00053C6EED|nr:PREDICTED: thiamine-repressible mitochondrial transport protein THI74 [Tarenaya hassleriana]XP_010547059.1 PREDICTED: thiamine-repressible mitochondrial transport protein THI74 [Tarenaya hassleriana]
MSSKVWRWVLGLIYIFAVATIWIAASFVVQSVVDEGVSPFLVTFICNSLFMIYLPIFEIGRYLEDTYGSILFWRNNRSSHLPESVESEKSVLLGQGYVGVASDALEVSMAVGEEMCNQNSDGIESRMENIEHEVESSVEVTGSCNKGLDEKGRWTRARVAKVSLLICPFWFLAQLTFNISLKYTTLTSNTILSSASSLFTFLVSLVFLGEKFTWLKLFSVLLCMSGTIIVSLGDSESDNATTAKNPLLGDILSLVSAALYAAYITLIRKKLPDGEEKPVAVSMAQFLGFLGLFNFFIFLPVALVLHFTNQERFNVLTWKQFGLVVGKGLLDNVLSDYLWAKAVLLTTTTVATAGLPIQVPLAAIVDTLTGTIPTLTDYIGALAIMVGFAGINIPSDAIFKSDQTALQLESRIPSTDPGQVVPETRTESS